MSQNVRQTLGLVVLFGAISFAFLWLGVPGVAGVWVGMAAMWAIVGLAVGYWMGTDADAERLIPEMMRRLRAARSAERNRLQD